MHTRMQPATISIYTRHLLRCAKRNNKEWRRCACPKWIYTNFDGVPKRFSLKTTSWAEAERKAQRIRDAHDPVQAEIRKWKAEHQIVRVTIADALDSFESAARIRNLSAASVRKFATIRKQLSEWVGKWNGARGGGDEAQSLRYLDQLTTRVLTEWMTQWPDKSSLSRTNKRQYVISFFHFCTNQGWLTANPAKGMPRPITSDVAPTMPFTKAEYKVLLAATEQYELKTRNRKEVANQGVRLRALMQLMRWGGLAIRDACTLERHRLGRDNSLALYRAKTGVHVYVPLPPLVADEIRKVPPGVATDKGRYFFWSGIGDPRTEVSNWERTFRRFFKIANLKATDGTMKRCHPHMLRDTFAVEQLLAGMSLEDVAKLLGHSSTKTTEKHYAPWVRERQQQLAAKVKASWAAQGVGGTGNSKR